MTALLTFMSDDVRYEHVPTGAVFVGHGGIRQMGASALEMAEDMSFDIGSRVAGQGSYAFETICRDTNTGAIGPLPGTGGAFTIRGHIYRRSLLGRSGHLATGLLGSGRAPRAARRVDVGAALGRSFARPMREAEQIH